jgi:L-ascorbate metabolism protein UlaG (beta-lactamase superfamily)
MDPHPGDLSFTWMGHSSFLLQMGTTNILVDPVFSSRSSPVQFAGPRRFSELPLTADELPDIDVLFISHDHYDHLDYHLIRQIKDRVGAMIVPLGVNTILRGWGVDAEKITALDWWESVEINGVTYTLTPSQHFTGRNPLKGNSTLWGGLYLDNGLHRVYYTGDGGYNDVFKNVGERLGAPDLMIAECGQYDTAWAKIHMFPEETVQAGIDAGAEWLIPVHWGSFSICNHAWDDSIRRVTTAAENGNLLIATPQIGQTVDYSNIASYTEHWWEAYD